MKDILISVIVPVYKAEEKLDRCVESIVGQTHRNLEIILVDDGSPDSSPEICDKWALRDSRIKVIHKKNAGASSARNAGLSVATGEYVAFVDSDDWIKPDMYSSLLEDVRIFGVMKATCGLFFPSQDAESDSETVLVTQDEAIARSIMGGYDSPCCSLYAAELFSDIRFDESIAVYEDALLNYEINRKIGNQTFNEKKFYCYDIVEDEKSLHSVTKEKIHDRLGVVEYMWKNEIASPKLHDTMLKAYVKKILSIVEGCVRTDAFDCDWYRQDVRKNVRARLPELLRADVPTKSKLKLLLFNFSHPLYIALVRRVIKKNAK